MKIEVKHLSKSFGDITPLKDVSLTISQGEVVTIIGPSGTGKTTFIKCLNRLAHPTSGDILFDGYSILDKEINVTELRKRIGIVFQSYNLFNHLTIIENIMIPQIDILKKTKQQAYDNAIHLLKTIGLAEKALNYPDELSGGQQQRVAIVRALALDPEAIILDEPTSALDPTTVGEVEDVISKLAKSGKTIIMVTHQLEFAKRVSSRVVFMSGGYITEQGTPEEIFDHPKNDVTKRFIRNLKCLDLEVTSKDYDFIEMMNKVRNFCNNNNLPREKVYSASLVFEEIVHNNLVKTIIDSSKILFTVSYDEKKNDIEIEIKYTGDKFNPFELENMSIDMIKKFCTAKYTQIENREFTNKLLVSLN